MIIFFQCPFVFLILHLACSMQVHSTRNWFW